MANHGVVKWLWGKLAAKTLGQADPQAMRGTYSNVCLDCGAPFLPSGLSYVDACVQSRTIRRGMGLEPVLLPHARGSKPGPAELRIDATCSKMSPEQQRRWFWDFVHRN